jgi:tetratricopeptide (TPR) repeat protein
MIRHTVLLPFCLLLLAAGDGSRYNRCTGMVRNQPQLAYDQASSWRADGGGAAAMHCQALALLQLGQPTRAAGVLDAAAQALDKLPTAAADLHAQAGNAWLLGGDATRAVARFTWALDRLPATAPSRVDVLIDRARGHAALEDKPRTLADLSAAHALAPKNVEILLLRAELYLSLGDTPKAADDIAAARQLPMDADDKAVLEKLTAKLEK